MCAASERELEGLPRDSTLAADAVIAQLQTGRDAAQACAAAPAPALLSKLEAAYRTGQVRLSSMEWEARLVKERNQTAKEVLAGADRALRSPALTTLRQLLGEADQFAKAAALLPQDLLRRWKELDNGRVAVAARLSAVRTTLRTPDDYGRAALLSARIDQLAGAEPNPSMSVLANENVQRAGADLQASIRSIEAFLGPDCKRVADRFQRTADALDSDFSAADAAWRVTNLPGRMEACRASIAAASQKPALVAVPDLKGMPAAAVINVLRNAGLSWGGPQAAGHASSPALVGMVTHTLPPAFSMVPPGTPVVAFVWQEVLPPAPAPTPPVAPVPVPPTRLTQATVPTLGGLPSRLSMNVAIIASGLIPVYVGVDPTATGGQPGQFAGQDPAPGSQVPFGSQVRFGIYEVPAVRPPLLPTLPPVVAPPPVAATGGVPNVYGDTLERAQAKLEAAGLSVGGITYGDRPLTAELAGRVYYQDPPAGSRVRPGSKVALRQYGPLTSAPPPTVTPPPPPVVAGPTGAVQGNCATGEGPIGCTGSFAGNVYLACDGIAPANYPSTFTLRANGSAELQIPSPGNKPFTVIGTMDRSGRVQVDRTEEGVRHRWVAQFARSALAGGGGRLTGSGNYEANIDIVDVRMKRCTGMFSLK